MKKNIFTLIAGIAFGGMALSMPAFAFNPYPTPNGKCTAANTNSWDCLDWTLGNTVPRVWFHTSQNNDTSGWFGYNGENSSDFVFRGPSDLSCPLASARCILTLHGQVRINEITGDDLGIKVLAYDIEQDPQSPDSLCDVIGLGGFPWYASSVSTHSASGFNNSSYVPNPPAASFSRSSGSAAGNFGNIDLSAIIYNIMNSHVHNVTFTNDGDSPSYFTFDSDLWFDGDNGKSECHVSAARLEIVGADDIDPNDPTNLSLHSPVTAPNPDINAY